MPFDSFIKIDGIPGESTDSKHKDWIEVLSFHWGVNQMSTGSQSSGGARSSQRVDHQDLSFVHTIDKASPELFAKCCSGEHIKNVKIELCRATGDKTPYMKYNLEDVIVSSVKPGGASQDAMNLPLEEVAFSYGKIELTYTLTDHKTGKPSGDVKKWWSTVENKGG
jgi:type VI secretion system secreted protein Hcp